MFTIKPTVTAGTITSGGTSQVVDAARSRSYIELQNTSDTDMYLNFGGAATTGHLKIVSGASWYNSPAHCPVNSINVLCATTGKTYALMVG
jgi:hypothetical protein